jgi:hypothetical protein
MFLDRLDNQIDELCNTLVWFMRDGGGTPQKQIGVTLSLPTRDFC